jgi:hypothetical protein
MTLFGDPIVRHGKSHSVYTQNYVGRCNTELTPCSTRCLHPLTVSYLIATASVIRLRYEQISGVKFVLKGCLRRRRGATAHGFTPASLRITKPTPP